VEAEFKDGIASGRAFENAIERQLTTELPCTPQRVTKIEQRGSHDGMRMATENIAMTPTDNERRRSATNPR